MNDMNIIKTYGNQPLFFPDENVVLSFNSDIEIKKNKSNTILVICFEMKNEENEDKIALVEILDQVANTPHGKIFYHVLNTDLKQENENLQRLTKFAEDVSSTKIITLRKLDLGVKDLRKAFNCNFILYALNFHLCLYLLL